MTDPIPFVTDEQIAKRLRAIQRLAAIAESAAAAARAQAAALAAELEPRSTVAGRNSDESHQIPGQLSIDNGGDV